MILKRLIIEVVSIPFDKIVNVKIYNNEKKVNFISSDKTTIFVEQGDIIEVEARTIGFFERMEIRIFNENGKLLDSIDKEHGRDLSLTYKV